MRTVYRLPDDHRLQRDEIACAIRAGRVELEELPDPVDGTRAYVIYMDGQKIGAVVGHAHEGSWQGWSARWDGWEGPFFGPYSSHYKATRVLVGMALEAVGEGVTS